MTETVNVLDNLNTQEGDAGDDPVAALVGEGKKFADIKSMAIGKINADKHIETLERQTAEMQKTIEELEAKQVQAKTLDDIMQALDRSKGDEEHNNQQQTFTPDDIARLVDTRIAEQTEATQVANVRSSNRDKVNAAILSAFNNDAEAAVKYVNSKTSELRLTKEQIKELSESAPIAFISMIGLSSAGTKNSASPRGRPTINTSSGDNSSSGDGRKLSYYQAKRKEMGAAKYFRDYALQKQYAEDLRKLGDDFNDVEPL